MLEVEPNAIEIREVAATYHQMERLQRLRALAKKQNQYQHGRRDEDYGHAQDADQSGGGRAHPAGQPFVALVRNDDENARPRKRHEKRFEDSKRKVNDQRNYAVREDRSHPSARS